VFLALRDRNFEQGGGDAKPGGLIERRSEAIRYSFCWMIARVGVPAISVLCSNFHSANLPSTLLPMREDPFIIPIPDGFLSAVLHRARSRRIVILAHGHTGTKIETGRLFVHTARALADAGVNALRFDFFGSGESSGDFCEMSPMTEIADLKRVIGWARRQGFSAIGVLGLSFGGAVSICVASQIEPGILNALVTWSSVPKFGSWRMEPDATFCTKKSDPTGHGKPFFTDRPKVDVPDAYISLRIPKLQIQGDNDLPGFREQFSEYFAQALKPKRHVIIPGADHTFTLWPHRHRAIRETVKWFLRYLD
jgi:alpha/beta superfamily hydrolase